MTLKLFIWDDDIEKFGFSLLVLAHDIKEARELAIEKLKRNGGEMDEKYIIEHTPTVKMNSFAVMAWKKTNSSPYIGYSRWGV